MEIVASLSGNVYEVRRMILGCLEEEENVVACIPSSYLVTSNDPTFTFRKFQNFVFSFRSTFWIELSKEPLSWCLKRLLNFVFFSGLSGHTVMSLSTPSMYSVYPGGFGYPTPASPTSGGCPTPSFGFHHSMALPVTNGCFPPGFPSRPPQPFGAPHNAMAGGGGGGAPFLRNALSTKNLQAFNAYQTHLYPDVYPEYRQGWLISSILSLLFVGFSLNTRCVMECQTVPPTRNLFNDFRFSFV